MARNLFRNQGLGIGNQGKETRIFYLDSRIPILSSRPEHPLIFFKSLNKIFRIKRLTGLINCSKP